MLNTDEYMKTIIGDTYTRSEINIKEPTLQTVDLYPESYLKINPIGIKSTIKENFDKSAKFKLYIQFSNVHNNIVNFFERWIYK